MKRTIFYLSLAVMSVHFYSCGDDELQAVVPDPDSEKPVITILAPADITKPLRATVILRATATDNTGIAKVEVFVDGTSIASAATSPVEASWDTKTVSDGSHVIKIVAEDAEGNTEEKSLTVEVKNILFQFIVGGGFIIEDREQWVFISNQEGKVVSVKQLENGETYVVNTPEGFTPDSRYYLSRLQYNFSGFEFGSFTDSFIVTYADVRPGTYTFDFEQSTVQPFVGQYQIFVSGSPTNSTFDLISFDASRGFFIGLNPPLTPVVIAGAAKLFKSPADLLFYFYDLDDEEMGRNRAPVYLRIQEATVGGETTVDYASLPSLSFNQINFVGATKSRFRLSYLRNVGEYQDLRVFLEQDNLVTPNELKIYFPEITFPEYITEINYSIGSTRYFYQKASTEVATEFKQLQGSISDFSRTGNKISIQATGNYTHVGTSSFSEINEENDFGFFGWALFGSKNGAVELIVPEIPTEILAVHPEVGTATYDFKAPTLYNFIGLNNYDEVVDARFTGMSIFKKAKEFTWLTQTFSPSGGRVGSKQERSMRSHDIPEMDLLENRKR